MINDGQTIILTFDYRTNEISRSFLFAFERNGLADYISVFYRRIAVASVLFFAVFYYLGWAIFAAAFLSVLSAAFLTAFVPLVFFYSNLRISDYFQARFAQSDDYKPITVAVTFIFDDDGFKRDFKSGPKKYSWAQVIEAVETDAELFIFTNKMSGDLIPKRVFAGANELNQFKSLVKAKIGDRAKF